MKEKIQAISNSILFTISLSFCFVTYLFNINKLMSSKKLRGMNIGTKRKKKGRTGIESGTEQE